MKTPKYTPREKRMILVAIAILVIYLIASVFFWLRYNWIAGFIPTAFILVVQIAYEIKTYKTLKIPLFIKSVHLCVRGVKGVREKFTYKKADVPQETPQSNLIDSISNLLLKDFIQIVAYQKYDLLGTGSDEEKKKCFNDLYSQYEAARENETIKEDVIMRKQIIALQVRQDAIAFNVGILKDRYTIEAVRGLQHYFKDFYGKPIYSFSLKTLKKDLDMVVKSEIATKRKLRDLAENYQKLQEGKKGMSTPESVENNFMDTIIWIKETLKMTFDENGITVLMYARLEARATKIIKYQQQQNAKRKNGR